MASVQGVSHAQAPRPGLNQPNATHHRAHECRPVTSSDWGAVGDRALGIHQSGARLAVVALVPCHGEARVLKCLVGCEHHHRPVGWHRDALRHL